MVKLNKELKVRLLNAIKNSEFDILDFPELRIEVNHFEIELIDRSEQVDFPNGQIRNDILND